MQIYTNRAFFAFNKGKQEIVINFMQESPSFEPLDGSVLPKNRIESAAELVMTIECAKDIAQKIMNLIEQAEKDQ